MNCDLDCDAHTIYTGCYSFERVSTFHLSAAVFHFPNGKDYFDIQLTQLMETALFVSTRWISIVSVLDKTSVFTFARSDSIVNGLDEKQLFSCLLEANLL